VRLTPRARGAFRALLGLSCVVTALLVVAACDDKGAPGDPCKPTDAQCLDPHTELACESGVLVAAPCKGPKGCRETGQELLCDFSENEAGDRCARSDEGAAQCRPSHTERIRCTGGAYVIEPCRGDDGCHTAAGKVLCDQSRGKAGEPCSGKTHACTMDGKALLECADGRFQQSAACPGEGGCAIGAGAVQCDQRSAPKGAVP
jgi:hypothetical protein